MILDNSLKLDNSLILDNSLCEISCFAKNVTFLGLFTTASRVGLIILAYQQNEMLRLDQTMMP